MTGQETQKDSKAISCAVQLYYEPMKFRKEGSNIEWNTYSIVSESENIFLSGSSGWFYTLVKHWCMVGALWAAWYAWLPNTDAYFQSLLNLSVYIFEKESKEIGAHLPSRYFLYIYFAVEVEKQHQQSELHRKIMTAASQMTPMTFNLVWIIALPARWGRHSSALIFNEPPGR